MKWDETAKRLLKTQEAELAALREENARLRSIAAWESAWQEGKDDAATFARERDEARAKLAFVEKQNAEFLEAAEERTADAEAKLAKVVEAAEQMVLAAGLAEPATRRYAAENLMAALAAARGE